MIYVLSTIVFMLFVLINYFMSTMYEEIAERQKSGAKAKKYDGAKSLTGLVIIVCSVIMQIWLMGHGLMHIRLTL